MKIYLNAPAETAPLLNDHRSGFEGRSAKLLMGEYFELEV
jgi:hypothetical protein